MDPVVDIVEVEDNTVVVAVDDVLLVDTAQPQEELRTEAL
jgi:hypothetical protein